LEEGKIVEDWKSSALVLVSQARLFILPKGKKSLGTCLFHFGS